MPRFRRRLATWSLVGLVAVLAARGVAGNDPAVSDLDVAKAVSRSVARAVAKVRRSVVTIRAFGSDDGYGAGIIVRSDGRVLTALHVVDGATALAVTTDDGEEYPARMIATDKRTDLALLEIVTPRRRFTSAHFGRDDQVAIGESLLVVSNPFGVGTTATRGILSARERDDVVPDIEVPLLQTDAVINPGSSGGALVNLRGEVVGIITAILTRTGGHQGIGFAVPAAEMRRQLPHLHEGKAAPKAWIGLRLAPSDGGLRVKKIVAGGPAAEAGLEVGDLIESIGGDDLAEIADLRSILRQTPVGRRLPAKVRRGTKSLRLHLRVGSR